MRGNNLCLNFGNSENRNCRQRRQSGKIGAADKIGSRGKSASARGSVGVPLQIFCRIGSRSARPTFLAEIATLVSTGRKVHRPARLPDGVRFDNSHGKTWNRHGRINPGAYQ